MPPSMPPTPALSYSPSPPESPSSENHTLSLDPERTPRARTRTQGALVHNEAARRRKRIDDEEDEEQGIQESNEDEDAEDVENEEEQPQLRRSKRLNRGLLFVSLGDQQTAAFSKEALQT